MRRSMVNQVSKVIETDNKTILFLVDIGVWAFRDILKKYPERAMNAGIFEDGLISIAAGTALRGMNPIIYGITPFLVERGLEQLKLNFAYQKLGGNFITTGAAYDFSTLGYSHYCPEDFAVLKTIPGIEIVAPGTGEEFEQLFYASYANGNPTYFRLSDTANKISQPVDFGKAAVIKRGIKGTVIAVSTMLDLVLESCKELDVTILYYTTLNPFDKQTLYEETKARKVFVCEPHQEGSLVREIYEAFSSEAIEISCIGIPAVIDRTYGKKEEKDNKNGFTIENIRFRVLQMIGE